MKVGRHSYNYLEIKFLNVSDDHFVALEISLKNCKTYERPTWGSKRRHTSCEQQIKRVGLRTPYQRPKTLDSDTTQTRVRFGPCKVTNY